ncbi:dinitrogenase iron-molybdenum cofactor biosynthesis protein [Candidatus Fermentibacteria bacterium]|nr:MAG: dinitrogenase iron-molybdenum cofactor biosynthesis protein [Candidatus Fermentibacteria bacterium]PIE52830.1 MAG: dinitrogenase iron-molybdenum cofactor biosynthesis protein [Candidatus Fermentibacteria bacterium]
MRVALSVWNGRIAPLFDVACNMQVYDSESGEVRELSFPEGAGVMGRIDILSASSVDVLICGAVSRPVYRMMASSGLDIRSFVSGETNEVRKAFFSGELDDISFTMPGCWGCRCRAGTGRRGKGHGSRCGRKEV